MQRPKNIWVRSILGISLLLSGIGVGPIFTVEAATSIVQTTYEDYVVGSTLQDTILRENDVPVGTSIVLATNISEDFLTPTLNPVVWTIGYWPNLPICPPTVLSSIATLTKSCNAYIQSKNFYPRPDVAAGPVTVEFLAKFNSTPDSQESAVNIGLGYPDLNYQYIVFSTFDPGNQNHNTGSLYAKMQNVSMEGVVDLGSTFIGAYHRFRIDWFSMAPLPDGSPQDKAVFYVDGALVATLTGANSEPAHQEMSKLYTYISNKSQKDDVNIDWIRISPPYKPSGVYTSTILDAGSGNVFKKISWAEIKPAGTDISVETSSSPNATDPSPYWSPFLPVLADGKIDSNSRYIQYRVKLTAPTLAVTPQVSGMKLDYGNPSADLSLDNSTFPPYVHSGETYSSSYTFAVKNNGPDSATGLFVSDLLPATITYTGMMANPDWSCNTPIASKVVCSYIRNGGLLTSGSTTQVVTINVTGTGGADGTTRDNLATVVTTAADPISDNNNKTATTYFTNASTDLSILKTASSSLVGVGRRLSYTLHVVNNGINPATSIKVIDTVPNGLSIILATGYFAWNCTTLGQVVSCDRATMDGGGSSPGDIIITVSAPFSPVTLVNTATVSASIGDSNLSNNTATVTTKVATLTFLPVVLR